MENSAFGVSVWFITRCFSGSRRKEAVLESREKGVSWPDERVVRTGGQEVSTGGLSRLGAILGTEARVSTAEVFLHTVYKLCGIQH